jgi:hypothetical protein
VTFPIRVHYWYRLCAEREYKRLASRRSLARGVIQKVSRVHREPRKFPTRPLQRRAIPYHRRIPHRQAVVPAGAQSSPGKPALAFLRVRGLPSDVPVTISGITFDSVRTDHGVDTRQIYILNSTADQGATFDYTKIRITSCHFKNGERQVWWEGRCFGVVDHCQFYDFRESGAHVRGGWRS